MADATEAARGVEFTRGDALRRGWRDLPVERAPRLLHAPPMPDREFPNLDALIRQAEEAAAESADPLAVMVALIKLVIASEADPYLVSGALVEGVTATIARKIPPELQGEVSVEAVRLLRDRLRATGAI